MLVAIIRKVVPNLRDPRDRWKSGVAAAGCLTGILTGSGIVPLIAGICLAIVVVVIVVGAWFTWVAPYREAGDEEREEDTGLPWLPPL